MKRDIVLPHCLSILVLLTFVLTNTCFAQKGPKEEFSFPALHKVQTPKVQKLTLKNGMTIYLVEDHQYPTIDLRALVRVGSVYEPEDETGLASITGTVLRTGGTQKMTGDEIDKILETMGGTIETGVEEGLGYVYMSILKEDQDKGISILSDILMHPVFNEDKIDLAKIEMRSSISRRNDNIWSIASREFNSVIYGKTSPYARYPEYATVDAITRDDIVSFYEKYFHPNNIVFAAWGDFDAKDMQKRLQATFANWPSVRTEYAESPKVDYQYRYTVNFIQKSDVNQSNIQMGHIGGLMNDPDYPALVVMNQILSMDRMFKVLRSKEGLTYAPWGNYGADYDHPGVFSCGTQTKSQSTVYAIRLMLNEVKRMTTEPVTDDELALAKDSYLNSFVFNFDSKSKIVTRMMTYAYYNYPLDFIERLREGVEKVTKDDILRAAKSHLQPDKMQILVVGNKDEFGEPLSSLGDVDVIDIAIPSPPSEAAPEATDESRSKGKDLFDKVREAVGGMDALTKITNIWTKLDFLQSTEAGDMQMSGEATIVYPNHVFQSISTPMGEMKMVVAGEKGWMVGPQGKMPMQESMRKNLLDNLFRDPVNFLTHADELQIQYVGEKPFNNVTSYELLVTGKEGTFHLYLDEKTYLPAGVSFQSTGQQGPMNVEEMWSDYRTVAGAMLPFKTIANANGKKMAEVTAKEMKVNIEIDPTLFEEK